MIRLLLLLVAGGLIAVSAAWLADHDGVFLLTMNGYELRTSAGFAVFLLILTAAVFLLLLRLSLAVMRSPGRFGSFFSARRARKGYQALSSGLIAAASGDGEEATRQARRSAALAGAEPLTLLLQAEAARLSGEDDRLETIYHTMLASPETAFLALRGLAHIALRRRDDMQALDFLTRANAMKPDAGEIANTLFALRLARREWPEAQTLLTDAARTKGATGAFAERRRGVLLAAEAQDADRGGDGATAFAKASDALALAPGLTVPALIAVRPLTQQGRSWKAQDIIEAAWIQAPHPALAEAYAAIRPEDSREARAKRLVGLAQLNPMHRESLILAAEQGLGRRRWAEARAILERLAAEGPTRRLCMLMAGIAQGEGDSGAAQSWQARAADAPEDAQWICAICGEEAGAWSALCPHCGGFDALTWTVKAQRTAQFASGTPQGPHPFAAQAFLALGRDAHRLIENGGMSAAAAELPPPFFPPARDRTARLPGENAGAPYESPFEAG